MEKGCSLKFSSIIVCVVVVVAGGGEWGGGSGGGGRVGRVMQPGKDFPVTD